MNFSEFHVVLGSRSPRRLALLRQLLTEDQITVCPPRSAEEQGFAGLDAWTEIENRLREIAREKCDDVLRQCRGKFSQEQTYVLAADTVIVAQAGNRHIALGQPPEPAWRETVRFWFENYLFGKTHKAATAVCLASLAGQQCERTVVSEVTFFPAKEELLAWYLDSEEPRGKAGGYGIQAAGSVFVSELTGSITNVIGLPLREIWEMFQEFPAQLG